MRTGHSTARLTAGVAAWSSDYRCANPRLRFSLRVFINNGVLSRRVGTYNRGYVSPTVRIIGKRQPVADVFDLTGFCRQE
ncbi:hypothetical protein Dda3937_04452 [Dickeya dadantii 3937]|uniref:Uncharacterized protein n=1 Tax=Dickeya dadantii (strain 3937) TaxID=198628 RepID=E0SI98_DICD3|nr:hypothetical protein Dda3937_04452 [Dickeya dadantii 3937]